MLQSYTCLCFKVARTCQCFNQPHYECLKKSFTYRKYSVTAFTHTHVHTHAHWQCFLKMNKYHKQISFFNLQQVLMCYIHHECQKFDFHLYRIYSKKHPDTDNLGHNIWNARWQTEIPLPPTVKVVSVSPRIFPIKQH